MRNSLLRALLCFAAPCVLCAQKPVIYPHKVVNAASYSAWGIPSGSIARGSIFSIFGTHLGPAQGVQVSSYPISTALSGVTIKVTQGGSSVDALPIYVRQDQVNAIMPSNAPQGWVSVRVTYNGSQSNPSSVYVVNTSPGLFTLTGTGAGPAAAQNVVGEERPLNTNQAAAKPGQFVTVYATGLGPITDDDSFAPPVGNLPTDVKVFVGGVPAQVSYSGRSPCCSGLDQVTFTIPDNAPQGCWVPVYIRAGGTVTSNAASLAISADGSPCSDPANPLSGVLIHGGKLSLMSLVRAVTNETVGVTTPVDLTSDFLAVQMTELSGGPFVYAPFASLPPPGACTIFQGLGDLFTTGQVPEVISSTAALDGGSMFSLTTPSGDQSLTLESGIAYLGSRIAPGQVPNRSVLNPGTYTVSSSGGADVPALQADITIPDPLNWSDRDSIENVSRSQPLTLHWTGAPPGQGVRIFGGNTDLPANSSAFFFCLAPAGATDFTIPAEVLSAVPASHADALASKGVIYLVTETPALVKGNGFDPALTTSATAVYWTGKTVAFQ